MDTVKLLLAAALLCAPTWLWLERIVPRSVVWRRLLIAGYSVPIGILLTTIGMRFLSLIGVEHSLVSLGGWAALTLVLARMAPVGLFADHQSQTALPMRPANRAEQLFIAFCLALIASRLVLLGLELTTRPIFAWDTKQHWGKQAKVFFELRSFAPYVTLQEWLDLGGNGVYTNMHPDYPKSTPLLQSFTAIALGEWNGSLVNVYWLLMWLALGLIAFSQATLDGARASLALAGTYMLLSMPYLNTQVALAGYADLLLATCYLGAFAAFYNWSHTRQAWLLLLAMLCALSGLLVKNEGFYWLLSFLPGFILLGLGIGRGVAVLAALALALLVSVWLMPGDMVIAGHSLDNIDLGYRPESWGPIFTSLLLHDNWHLAFYAFLLALLCLPALGSKEAPGAAVLLSALSLYLALYVFTSNAFGAVQFTSVNRVGLQLMPAMSYFALVIVAKLCARQESTNAQRSCSQSPSPA